MDQVIWFRIATPDLSDEELWGPEFQLLKQHMSESPFREHLESLWQAVKKTEEKQEAAAENLGTDDEVFRESWKKLKSKRAWASEPSITPYQPEGGETKPYYRAGYCANVMDRFYKIDSELFSKQRDLEQRLQTLWDDLLPDNVESLLAPGHCEKCHG